MPILFGVRRRSQRIGVLMWPCERCGTSTAHILSYIRAWFTLFFIPVIPLPMQRRLVCNTCGHRDRFDSSQREEIERAARTGAAREAAITQAAAAVPQGPMAPPSPNLNPPQPAPVSSFPPPSAPGPLER